MRESLTVSLSGFFSSLVAGLCHTPFSCRAVVRSRRCCYSGTEPQQHQHQQHHPALSLRLGSTAAKRTGAGLPVSRRSWDPARRGDPFPFACVRTNRFVVLHRHLRDEHQHRKPDPHTHTQTHAHTHTHTHRERERERGWEVSRPHFSQGEPLLKSRFWRWQQEEEEEEEAGGIALLFIIRGASRALSHTAGDRTKGMAVRRKGKRHARFRPFTGLSQCVQGGGGSAAQEPASDAETGNGYYQLFRCAVQCCGCQCVCVHVCVWGRGIDLECVCVCVCVCVSELVVRFYSNQCSSFRRMQTLCTTILPLWQRVTMRVQVHKQQTEPLHACMCAARLGSATLAALSCLAPLVAPPLHLHQY